ncbi:hypothetical protein Tco_1291626 [Tanacetum coccineum]
MTKVIKGEFEKIKDIKVEDDSLACDTPLKVFNCEVNQLSKMDDDLFTYEVEFANIPCGLRIDDDSEYEADDDMGFDPSDIAFTEWLGSKFFNYKTMDHSTMKALWINWIRGDDEVELTDEESYNDKDDVTKVFRIDTNIFDYETPLCSAFKEFNYLLEVDPDLLTKDIIRFKTYEDYKDDWIYEWNKDVPWVDEKPWTDVGVWTKPTPVKHTCKPFNYKTGCSEWPTCSWKDDGYCNGGNLPGAYIIGNQLHYQDYEWYEALEDCKLKDEALRNKAIMEGFIKEDDDESRYEQKRQWNTYTNYDDAYEINHEHNKREELCEIHEPTDLENEKSMNIVGELTNLEILKCWSLENLKAIWDNKNVHNLGSVETEFPAIVFNDTLTSEAALSCEPTVSSLNDEIDFRISFDESDDEDCTITILKTNTPYPSRRYGVSVPAPTKDHTRKKLNTPYPKRLNTPYSRNSADKSKITRKQSKASKHGHENQKSSKRSQRSKALANLHLQGPFLQFSKVLYNLKRGNERQGPNVQSFQTSTVLTVKKRSGNPFTIHRLSHFHCHGKIKGQIKIRGCVGQFKEAQAQMKGQISLIKRILILAQAQRPRYQTSDKKQEEIVMVRDFPEVFSDDLSGLPPIWKIEFRIVLTLGATLVAKSPYRLAPSELE